MEPQTRLTPPVALHPVKGDADLEMLIDYDRETARLATESLARAENRLRETHPFRFVKRASLRHTARIQRQTLIALGADLRPLPPSIGFRAVRATIDGVSSRKDRLLRYNRRNDYFPAGIAVVVCVIAGAIYGIVQIDGQSPAELGAEQRGGLEQLMRSEVRYASEHDGKFTTDFEALDNVTPDGGADTALYGIQYETDIVLIPNGYDAVAREGDTSFRLRVQGKTVTATCRGTAEHGCSGGRWQPEQLPGA